MKFSIIMPVYNTEKYVETSILSVLNQTYSDYELVCVNDGSTDNSEEILNKFADNEKVKIIKHEHNQGLLAARISGVKNAAGQYILFLDSDDWLEPKALHTLYRAAKKDNYDYIEFNYCEVRNGIKKRNVFSKADNIKDIENVLLSNANHTIWNKCFNAVFLKPIIEQMKCFFSIYAEDYYQMAIIEYYAKKRKRIGSPLHNYRIDSGITNSNNFNNIEKFKLMDLSMQNVYQNLCNFYMAKEREDCICYVKEFNYSFYIKALKNTTSKEIIDIIKKRFGEDGFVLLLIKEINNLNTKIEEIDDIYRPLAAFSKQLRPLMNILRNIRNYIAERK